MLEEIPKKDPRNRRQMSAKAVSGVARCGLHTYAVAAGKAMSKSAESKAASVFLSNMIDKDSFDKRVRERRKLLVDGEIPNSILPD
jgi:hypothetical protein